MTTKVEIKQIDALSGGITKVAVVQGVDLIPYYLTDLLDVQEYKDKKNNILMVNDNGNGTEWNDGTKLPALINIKDNYVKKAGDTMNGDLTLPTLNATSVKVEGHEVYSPSNKPTASDVDALPADGKAKDSYKLNGRDDYYNPDNKPSPSDLNVYSITEVDNKINNIEHAVNNIHTNRDTINWSSGLNVTNPLQIYLYNNIEYLPNANAVPFITNEVFEVDKFDLSLKYQQWRDAGDARGWGLIPDIPDDQSKIFKEALSYCINKNKTLNIVSGTYMLAHIGEINVPSYQDNAVTIKGQAGLGNKGTILKVSSVDYDYWLKLIGNQGLYLHDIDIYTDKRTGKKAGVWREKHYKEGDIITPIKHNGFIYECIVGGNSNAEEHEPLFPTSIGETVQDNEVIWKCKDTTEYFVGIRMTEPKHHVLDLKNVRMEGFSGAAIEATDLIACSIDNVEFRRNHVGLRARPLKVDTSTTVVVNRGYNSANDYAYLCISDNANTAAFITSQFLNVIFEYNRIGAFVAGNGNNLVMGCYGEANTEHTYYDSNAFTTFICNQPSSNQHNWKKGDSYISQNQESSVYIESRGMISNLTKYTSRHDLEGTEISPDNCLQLLSKDLGLLGVKDTINNKYRGILTPIVAPTRYNDVVTDYKCLIEIIKGVPTFNDINLYDGWTFEVIGAGQYRINFNGKYIKPRVQVTAFPPNGLEPTTYMAFPTFIGHRYHSLQEATGINILMYKVNPETGIMTPESCSLCVDIAVSRKE